MNYNGVNLVLDNFRGVLSEYDVDVQDVVRSAILDGVDLEVYIEKWKSDPYKLDQIRLSLKEGVPQVLYDTLSGEQLYIIRKLRVNNYNIEPIISQVKSGKLSGCYMDYLISWVTKGIDISGIKVSVIPKKMLEIFDMHLSQGRDMRPFNNGRIYTREYVLYCVTIQEKGKDISRFVNENWSEPVLSYLSGVVGTTSEKIWSSVLSVVNSETSLERVKLLFKAAKMKLPVEDIGKDIYDNNSISFIIEASKNNFDYRVLMNVSLSSDERRAKLDEMKMNRGRKVGGVLRRG